MTSFFTILLIGISLSMDAFSLSLIYGMLGISEKNKIKLAIIVGIFHFFMPIIGNILGYFISDISYINLDIVACVILLYIGTSLIISNFKDEDVINNRNNYLMFFFIKKKPTKRLATIYLMGGFRRKFTTFI